MRRTTTASDVVYGVV